MRSRFPLGQTVATPGALEILETMGTSPLALLARHQSGDWGDVPPEDATENELSVEQGFRILSSYRVGSTASLGHHRSRPQRHHDSEARRVLKGDDRAATRISRSRRRSTNWSTRLADHRDAGRYRDPSTDSARRARRKDPRVAGIPPTYVVRDEYAVTSDGMRLFGFWK